MEIHSVHINFDNNTLEVNGKLAALPKETYVLNNNGEWKRKEVNAKTIYEHIIVSKDNIYFGIK